MWSPKETTLRVIRFSELQVYLVCLPARRFDTFLTEGYSAVIRVAVQGSTFFKRVSVDA